MPHISSATGAAPDDGDDSAPPDDDPDLSLDIDVVLDGGDWDQVAGAEQLVRAAAEALAGELAISHAEVCVALSNDEQVAELNGSYRGKPKPTNVLSFPAVPMLPVEGEPRFLGDIVLALETLQREAADLGVPLAHHMQHLVVHGLLHLLGYDHQTEDEAREMEGLEVRVLSRLGVADPYAAAGEPMRPDSEHD
ncbi:MAG: rRNA maturation RNase YbeY [Hyphomicrobium sp.]|jgi:probable rRNA maturation factor